MNTNKLKNDFLEIEYLTDALRIIVLKPAGKTNLLADMRDASPIPTPYGNYHFIGGHRLWHSPEVMPRTYIPDTPVTITELSDGVILEAQTEQGTGIRKRIEIRLDPERPSVSLLHTLVNDGLWTVEFAPWAITQFRLGGTVIMPMPVGNVDETGLLSNRHISYWPYTRINDPRVRWDDKFVLFTADALLPPFKIGYFNPLGWMAYWMDTILFRKTFGVTAGASYPDNNCNAEMYCNDRFVELESLSPLTRLAPGELVNHLETWELLNKPEFLPDELENLLY